MFKDTPTFSGFSSNDLTAAKRFYGDTLGIPVKEDMGALTLELADHPVFVYPKDDHVPATFTVLNFQVPDVERAVDELTAKGIRFERYPDFPQDAKGIMRGQGPDIAWFKDPAGNVLSVIKDEGNGA
jgi:catechol 2,3-dioxygenase-like lactoylglutathione lyase family enzyme